MLTVRLATNCNQHSCLLSLLSLRLKAVSKIAPKCTLESVQLRIQAHILSQGLLGFSTNRHDRDGHLGKGVPATLTSAKGMQGKKSRQGEALGQQALVLLKAVAHQVEQEALIQKAGVQCATMVLCKVHFGHRIAGGLDDD